MYPFKLLFSFFFWVYTHEWNCWIIWLVLFLVFLRTSITLFYSGCTTSHSYLHCMRVLFFPYPCKHLLFADFLMIVILTGVRWYFTVVLIYTSLIISNDEHLFMCLLAICMSSMEKCLFRSSAHFLIVWFVCVCVCVCVCCMDCLYGLDINPLWVLSFVNIFFHSVGCLFV